MKQMLILRCCSSSERRPDLDIGFPRQTEDRCPSPDIIMLFPHCLSAVADGQRKSLDSCHQDAIRAILSAIVKVGNRLALALAAEFVKL
jgi:hypothetical protein